MEVYVVKKELWMRKSQKRKIKGKDRGFVEWVRILYHFFGNFTEWVNQMRDPRNKSYITYTQADLVYMALLKNICSLKSMRQMDECFNEECCIDTLRCLSGDKKLEEMPHYDTLNYYLEMLPPEELSEVLRKMAASLIRRKQFYKNRLLGQYWRVILDGTQLYYFKEKHCENCLRTTVTDEAGKKTVRYYHRVVEAKLVLGKNLVISMGTEFIENESEDVGKQDCELNAAKRLLERIKKEYPRMPLCIQGDALYAVEPVMRLCREKDWRYVFTQKDTRQKLVSEAYHWILEGEPNEVKNIGKELGTGRYANDAGTTAGRKEKMNVYEYRYETRQGREVCFQWITDIEITKRNLEEMIEAGRGRWKIENEGFNSQKNGIYDIEHLNSRNSNAMKNHYLLTQIADLVMQLYLAWTPLGKQLRQSIKSTSSRLLESFRSHPVTDEDVRYIQKHTSVYLE